MGNQRQAQAVFETLCKALDERHWKYEKHPDDLVITFDYRGEDIPMSFVMAIDAEREVVQLFSTLPFLFGRDKRVEGAIATSCINYLLADGSFDYDYKTGTVRFRLTATFRDSLISPTLLLYMVAIACRTVDDYNDKLLMVAKGVLAPEDITADEL